MRFWMLIFGLFGAISSAQTVTPVFDVRGELQLADWRLEMAARPPAADQTQVAALIRKLSENWREEAPGCQDLHTPAGLTATKTYLQNLLHRLARASHLEDRIQSEFGVCVSVDLASSGWFSFANSPHLDHGIIHMPVPFIQQAGSEDELAFALSHEFAHYLLHAEILNAYAAGTGRAQGEIRAALETKNESEADELAMKLVVNAGYDLSTALSLTAKVRKADGGLHLTGDQLAQLRELLLLGLPSEQRAKISVQPSAIPKIVVNEWAPRA